MLTLGILGLAAMGLGVLMFFAGMMSDAPIQGDRDGRNGAILFVVGLLVIIGGAIAKHYGMIQ